MKYYKVTYQKNQKILTQVVSATKLEELQSTVTIIKCKEKQSFNLQFETKISTKSFLEILLEIELMMRSHLSLYDAIKILHKSIQKPSLKALLKSMMDGVYQGKRLEESIRPFEKRLDPLIVSFFKIAHEKGNMHYMIKALCDILQTKYENQKLILSSLAYPLFIVISFCMAMMVIFHLVIPKFEHVFIQYNLTLPFYTTLLLEVKSFFVSNGLFIVLLSFLVYIILSNSRWVYYKHRWLIEKLPIISLIYKYYELHKLFMGLRVLMNSNYEFNVALENSQFLLKNQYLLGKIQNLQQHIHNGMSLYEAFLKVNIFDELVLNVIHSAQMSSTLNEALEKIELYYKNKFTTMIKRLSAIIEPLFFVMMMLLILWVMLAIFTPIWNMSALINL